MRRIKKFIWAENTLKDPNWKISDNPSTCVSEMSMAKNNEEGASPEEKNIDEMRVKRLSVSRLM